MACCAAAAWLFGFVVNGFRAVTGRRRDRTLAWPEPATWNAQPPAS